MFRNYLTTALRNLVRNRLSATINIVGLSVAFAAAMFAALFVRYELTYNQWIPNHERVFTFATELAMTRGTAPMEWTFAYRDAAAAMKLAFPEVEAAARIRGQLVEVVRSSTVHEIEPWGVFSSADPDFFKVIPFPVVAGTLDNALDQPDSLVLTRRLARKYFGRDAPLGEVLTLEDHPVRVTAVIEDFPTNTYFPGSMAMQAVISARAPFSSLKEWDDWAFTLESQPGDMVYGGTFVRLKAGASADAVQKGMPDFVKRFIPADLLGPVSMRLLPVAELHAPRLKSPQFLAARARFMAMIVGVAGIGALIVVAAGINYVNATVARLIRREVEVGVRKVSGATRRHVIAQFIGEAAAYVAIAMLIAGVLVTLALPAAQGFLDRVVQFQPWRDPLLLIGILTAVLVAGGVTGLYPSLLVSGRPPAQALKSTGAFHRTPIGRALVTVQFAILIGVIVVAGVMYRQARYAIDLNPIAERDLVLTLQRGCTPVLHDQVQQLSGVTQVVCGGVPAFGIKTVAQRADGTELKGGASFLPVAPGLLEMYGIQLVQGRTFDTTGEPGLILNETAATAFGFASPAAAIGQEINVRRVSTANRRVVTGKMETARIVGVVDDFAYRVEQTVAPTIYALNTDVYSTATGFPPSPLTVKLKAGQIPETLRAIDRVWASSGDASRPIVRQFLSQMREDSYRDLSRQGGIVGMLAGVALFIAAIGLLGLSALTVERRTKEIGVRKALGADRGEILRLMLWDFTKPVLWANLIAWPAAYIFARRWLEGFAYHISLEPWLFLASSAAALVIAVLTVIGHALLVARAQPVTALRYE